MRIDTLRNRIAATRDLLDQAIAELEDLHVLAYERTVAAQERVAGGERDYALDTHGDPRARDAFRELSDKTSDACSLIAGAAHDALRLLRTGDSPTPRTPRTITAVEHALTLEAQARRIQRGEYQPVKRYPQASRDAALQAVTTENKKLNRDVVRLTNELNQTRMDLADARHTFPRHGASGTTSR